jgi:hypothetical protein
MSVGVMAHEKDEVGLKTKTRIKWCPHSTKRKKEIPIFLKLNNCWFNFCTATLFLAHANMISADAIIIKEVSSIYIYIYAM